MKETQFRKNGKNDSRAGEEDTQKSRNRKLSREKKQNKRKQKNNESLSIIQINTISTNKYGLCRFLLIQLD